jgi:hypothetical protein
MEGRSAVNEISLDLNNFKYMSLYNGHKFPEYIFKEKPINILFFDFHVCFSDDFLLTLKEYLENVGIREITFNNIEPVGLPFNQTIETAKLPEQFNLAVKTTMTQNYIDSDASLYMYTELAEICNQDSENRFSLILDREYDLGILGTVSNNFVDIFAEFKIDDVSGYLSSLLGSYYTDANDNKVRMNYL